MTEKTKLSMDYILLALMVIFITLQPYFKHGVLNYYELGIYLPCIDAVFQGGVPYKDIFIARGPLEIYIPTFLMQIFGKNIAVLEGYFYFGTVLTLIICVFLGKQLYRTRLFTYLMALVLVAKTFARVNFNNWGGIRFGMGILAILFAIMFFKKEKYRWIFLSGISAALGLFISYEIGIFSAAAIIIALIFLKERYKAVSYFLLGFVVIIGPFLFYFYLNKALMPYLDAFFKLVINGTNNAFDMPSLLGSPRNLKEFISAFSPFNHNIKYMPAFFLYAGVFCCMAWRFFKKKFTKRDLMVICISIYGPLMYYGAFRDIEGPQYEMALQPAIIIAYLFLEKLFMFCKARKRVITYSVIFMIIGISIIYPIQRFQKRFFIIKYAKEYFLEKKGVKIIFSEESYVKLDIERAKGIVVPLQQAEEIEGVTEYIQKNTKPEEYVFTFPDLGIYNFLADRPMPGRFKTAMYSWAYPENHAELMKALRDQKPAIIINRKRYPEIEPFLPKVKSYMDEVYSYVSAKYTLVKNFGNIEVYEKKGKI